MAYQRYQQVIVPTKKDNKKTVVRSTLYPTIEPKPGDSYILTGVNDRLDTLSYLYYGTVAYWWIIAHANKLSNGSVMLEPGLRLVIPRDVDSIFREYEKINKLV